MKVLTAISFIFFCFSCNQSRSTNNAEVVKPADELPGPHTYNDTTIPGFFRSYINNHLPAFAHLDSTRFNDFCLANNLDAKDSQNTRQYFTIEIVHRLLTSHGPVNGSVGDIIKIPYYWHWVKPNPRHEIQLIQSNTPLSEIKTLALYPKYGSFADIDRTPYLFLSDLFGDYPKYRSAACDSFSSFGWCSEREMSFVYLAEMLGIEGKVIAENNHSWSILRVKMKDQSNKIKTFAVRVDNTYDQVHWNAFTKTDSLQWTQYYGTAALAKWYNAQAHSQKETARLRKVSVSSSAMKIIEESTIRYLRKRMAQSE